MTRKKYRKFAAILLTALISQSTIFVFANPQNFELHMIDVGEGLAVLVEDGGHYMLYDGGSESKKGNIIAYLDEHLITKLDYMIISCYNETHINGLPDVLGKIETDKILCPAYIDNTDTYNTFMSAAENSGAEIIHPTAGDSYTFNDADIEVISPETYDNDKENETLTVKIKYKNTDWLLCGDAENINTSDDLKADILVTGENGFCLTDDFLKAVDPQYTMISIDETDKFSGSGIYRTDKQGTIVCKTDGGVVGFDKKPIDDAKLNSDNSKN